MPAPSEDMYNDGPAAPATPAGDKPEGKEGDDGRKTFIVPKSAFSGRDIKPGEKCDFEVCMVHEDSVEMYPCEDHDEHEEEPAKTPEAAPAGDGGMSSMME